MPHWSSAVFHGFHDQIQEIDRVLHLCMDGLQQLAHGVPLAEALAELDKIDKPDLDPEAQKRRLESVRRRAEFASKEIERGFPILHAHAVVATWGALEAFIEDLVLAWLQNEPKLLSSDSFSGVRIPLAEYQLLDDEERLRVLLREFSRQSKADLKGGLSGFEILLESVGMAGGVEDETRTTLFEMYHVRNVLVHRAGVVDRRLAKACSWLNLAVGSKLFISHDKYLAYVGAIGAYMVELVKRSLRARGYSPEEAERLVKRDVGEAGRR